MPGEFAGGSFDVTNLTAIEIEELTGAPVVSNIIDAGENFHLQATFTGAGVLWQNLTGCTYVAQFYAKGMGFGVPDYNLGTTNGPVTGGGTYTVDSPTYNITSEGVYRCGVTVTFRTSTGVPFYGVLGFNEDCVIQVSESEE
jgi:hypothetical protein